MKTILLLFMALASATLGSCTAQIKNAKTATVKIYGNCGMCETTIENAGNVKKVAQVDWDKDTKMATVIYDTTKTSEPEILKRIALAGYDSDSFLAPDNAYAKLPGCCQYERAKKSVVKTEEPTMKMDGTDHSAHTMPMETQEGNPLTSVFDAYFAVKNALVQTNGATASEKSTALLTAIKAVKMEKLPMAVHTAWMQVLADLKEDAGQMAATKDPSKQRDSFMRLSKSMYALMSVAKYGQPVYYQFCPMANDGKGANWLSKESTVENPYYGSLMMSCGKTVETIK